MSTCCGRLPIVIVVLGHWTVIGHRRGRGLDGFSALEVLPRGRPITWLVQVMPILFMVGGFVNPPR